jgi:hypothetical protein
MTMARHAADVRAGATRRSEPHRQALRRLQAKQSIIAELIGGRLALPEATERFRALSADGRGDEAAGREVIGWVNLALGDRPERAEAFASGLEQELERYLTSHGPAHSRGSGHD